MLKPVLLFLFISFVIFLHDPIVTYALMAALQVFLFSEHSSLVTLMSLVGVVMIFLHHDMLLGDSKTFFLGVNQGLNMSLGVVLQMTVGWQFLHIVWHVLFRDPKDAKDIFWDMLPPLAVALAKISVDLNGDQTLVDLALFIWDYIMAAVNFLKGLFKSLIAFIPS